MILPVLIVGVLSQVGNAPIVGSIPQIPSHGGNTYNFLQQVANTTDESHSTFLQLVDRYPTLVHILQNQECTVFLPSNFALRQANVTEYGPERLERLLSYHITPKRLDLSIPRQYAQSAANEVQILLANINTFTVEYANTLTSVFLHTKSSNGWIFEVSNHGLLRPPPSFLELMEMGGFDRFLDIVRRVNLTSVFNDMKDVTLFIPVNAAFNLEVTNRTDTEWGHILMNHITSKVNKVDMTGKGEFLVPASYSSVRIRNDAEIFSNYTVRGHGNRVPSNIVQFDILTQFGFAHTIDSILVPANYTNTIPPYSPPKLAISSAAPLTVSIIALIVLFY
jgi:uncharacterized surface protein with fasciclin (FAS1) repeats